MPSSPIYLPIVSCQPIIAFGIGILSLFFAAQSSSAEQVTLAWDANPEPDVTGYRLHYGMNAGDYTESIDAGLTTTFTLSDLPSATSYYAVVTAYNSAGLESLPSNEIVFTTDPISDPVNLPPTVDLLVSSSESPPINQAVLVLDATATDPDGTVERVAFYNGTEMLDEQTTDPWSFTWTVVEAGTFTLTAVAFDNAGDSMQSTPFEVTVTAEQLQYDETDPILSPGFDLAAFSAISGGNTDSLLVSVSGELGQTFVIEYSENLIDWSVLGNVSITDSSSGSNSIVDPDTLLSAQRKFYRITLEEG